MAKTKQKPCLISLSFTKSQIELYYKIHVRCGALGISGWLKEAALEKLDREENPELYNFATPQTNCVSNRSNVSNEPQ